MGLMTGSGCLSRFMGPVFVSYVYTILGTVWTFGITTAIMAACMVWLMIFQRRLVVQDEAGAKVADEDTGGSSAREPPEEDDTGQGKEGAEEVSLQDIKTDK